MTNAGQPRERGLRLVPKRHRLGQSWGLGRFLLLIAFTVGFGALGIWQVRRQYEVVASGYSIDRNLFEYRRLLERQKRLTLLLSAYKDPTALRLFAERSGVAIPSGCRSGSCGTCETAMISGTVRYAQPPSFDIAEGRCLPCIAVPTSDLVLAA